MIRAAVDLHIHTALSPCADDDMTPNNIVNMASLKGLDIIAVADHNSCENLKAVSGCTSLKGITIVPAMEVQSREEVHLLCYFPNIDSACRVQDAVYGSLPPLENREDIFGKQLIFDEHDNIKAFSKRMLIAATGLGIEEIFAEVKNVGGVVVPAHIDRKSFSILSNLGSIPEDLNIKYLELSRDCEKEGLLKDYPGLSGYGFIRSSDAHRLCDIFERQSFISLEEISLECLMGYLGS